MVSASNLNFDCLELIFIYLAGNDLVSISLVSRSFLAGVIPRLYRSLIFGPKQAKRYPAVGISVNTKAVDVIDGILVRLADQLSVRHCTSKSRPRKACEAYWSAYANICSRSQSSRSLTYTAM